MEDILELRRKEIISRLFQIDCEAAAHWNELMPEDTAHLGVIRQKARKTYAWKSPAVRELATKRRHPLKRVVTYVAR